jgi:hypothetical protein
MGAGAAGSSIYAWCVGWYVHENSVLVVTLRLAASSQWEWVFSVIYLNIKFNFKYKLMVIFECNVNTFT